MKQNCSVQMYVHVQNCSVPNVIVCDACVEVGVSKIGLALRTHAYAIYCDFNGYRNDNFHMKVKSMKRTGTEAIRTQIQPSKPKREITK